MDGVVPGLSWGGCGMEARGPFGGGTGGVGFSWWRGYGKGAGCEAKSFARGRGAARRPPGQTGTAEKGAEKVSTQWKAVSGGFPHNGSMFREIFHTMEACFGHFSTQWKHVSRGFSTVWKNGGRPGLVGGWAPRAAGSGFFGGRRQSFFKKGLTGAARGGMERLYRMKEVWR